MMPFKFIEGVIKRAIQNHIFCQILTLTCYLLKKVSEFGINHLGWAYPYPGSNVVNCLDLIKFIDVGIWCFIIYRNETFDCCFIVNISHRSVSLYIFLDPHKCYRSLDLCFDVPITRFL